MNKEEKKAIEDMNRFANGIDMSCVTARQMQIILNLIEKKKNCINILDDELKERDKTINEKEIIIEKLQKENEELKRLMAHKNGYTKLLEEDLFENCSNYVIPIQTIKGKIEELKQEKEKYGNCLIKMYEDELVNRDIKILQELLEGRK